MPSSNERGAYGYGGKIRDWAHYNPLGAKIIPFKEDYRCAMCQSFETVFPIDIALCGKCAHKIMDLKDAMWRFRGKRTNPNGHFCAWCGRLVIVHYIINTRVCNKCTKILASQADKRTERLKFARLVVGDY